MSRARVLFVSYFFSNRTDMGSPLFYNNASYHLKAYLEMFPDIAESCEFEIVNLEGLSFLNRGQTEEENLNLLYEILRRKPDILAFSLYVWNSAPLHELARSVKQMVPEILTVVGGPEVYDRRDFAEHFPAFDVLVEGDGEIPLKVVLTRFAEGRS